MNARRIYVSLRISVVLFGSMHVTLWTSIMRLMYLASINKNDVLTPKAFRYLCSSPVRLKNIKKKHEGSKPVVQTND